MNIPNTMKAVLLEDYNPNLIRALGKMKVSDDVDLQKPGNYEVLIKLEASPINPSDIAFLRGGYNIVKPLPAIPGFEGSGLIVETGEGLEKQLIGRRVSFFNQKSNSGAWAEYAVVNFENVILLEYNLPVEQAACMFVNPFTAYALVEHILENQHQAIIQSAANGQVGDFIRYFAGKHSISIINLVRKPDQVDQLTRAGIENVLNINDDDFKQKLNTLANDLQATAAIDAVGGELTGHLLNAMPEGSEVLLYGGLSGAAIGAIDPIEIIFKNKVLSGFYLSHWMFEKTTEEFHNISIYIQKLLFNKEIEIKIHQVFPMNSFYDAIRTYISSMSAGKVLLKMD